MSSLVVQKYGGSVLRDADSVGAAAREAAAAVGRGDTAVAVVSALASVTERLLTRAERWSTRAGGAPLDLLLATGEIESVALFGLALGGLGVDYEALNPWQIGVHTDAAAGGARIVRVDPRPLSTRLAPGRVVVVPGFVGCAPDGRLTTLGRGGSDLTAIAVADALGASRCEFFKDVPGYFSADPDLVPHAIHRPEVTIEEALELSRFGCRFLQDRALEWAAGTHCAIRIRALGDARATAIRSARSLEAPPLLAVTHRLATDGRHAQVSIVGEASAILRLATEGGLDAALEQAAIPARVFEIARHRITIEVPLDRLGVSHLLVHDRLVGASVPALGRTA